MADPKVLFEALRLFGDPDATGFQYPVDEDDARKKWAAAFALYATGLTPPITTVGIAPAFYAALRFTPVLGPIPSATDLAAAWAASLTPPIPGVTWDLLVPDPLRAALASLFASPTLGAAARLKDIADAFHTATIALTSGGGTVKYS